MYDRPKVARTQSSPRFSSRTLRHQATGFHIRVQPKGRSRWSLSCCRTAPDPGCVARAARRRCSGARRPADVHDPGREGGAVTEIARLEAMTAELKLRVVADRRRRRGPAVPATPEPGWPRSPAPTRRPAEPRPGWPKPWTAAGPGSRPGWPTASCRPRRPGRWSTPSTRCPTTSTPRWSRRPRPRWSGYCEKFRPSELRRLGRHLLEVVAPEIAEAEVAKRLENEEQQAREKTSLRSRIIGDGMARTTITHPVARPRPAADLPGAFTSPANTTTRSPVRRTGSPTTAASAKPSAPCWSTSTRPSCPQHGGDATTVMVTIGLESLRSRAGHRHHRRRRTAVGHRDPPAGLQRRHHPRRARRQGRDPRPRPHPPPLLTRPTQSNAAPRPTVPRRRLHHPRRPGAKHITSNPGPTAASTDLDDGVLLCNWHHHRAHDPRFTADKLPNGDIRFHRRR